MNFTTWSIGRMAFYENFVEFFFLGALIIFYFCIKSCVNRKIKSAVPLIALFLSFLLAAYLSKPSVIFILAGLAWGAVNILFFFIFPKLEKYKIKILLLEFLCFVLVIALFLFIPSLENIFSSSHHFTSGKDYIRTIISLDVLNNEFMRFCPLIVLLSIFQVVSVFRAFLSCPVRNLSQRQLLDVFVLFAVIFGSVFLSVLQYHPVRYYYIMFPLLAVFSVEYIYDHFSVAGNYKWKKIYLLCFSMYCVYASLYSVLMLFNLKSSVKIYTYMVNRNFLQQYDIVAFVELGVLVLLSALVIFYKSAVSSRRGLLVSLITVSILQQIFYYSLWLQYKEKNIVRISEKFTSLLPEHSTISGEWAPVFCFGNNHVIYYSNIHIKIKRNVENIQELSPDYILVRNDLKEVNFYKRLFPNLIDKRNIRARFTVYHHDLILFSFYNDDE